MPFDDTGVGGRTPAKPGQGLRRLLITGFGPFPGVEVNASAAFARRLAELAPEAGPCRAVSHELPTSWQRLPQAADDVLAAEQPDACLHFGVSRHAQTFEVELCAHNGTEPRHDCDGHLPREEHLVAGAPALLGAGTAAWYGALRIARHGLPVRVSEDAGRYLCNALYFRMLWQARRLNRPTSIIFVHLPANLGQPGALAEATALACGLALMQAALDPPALAALEPAWA
jgi:pyroglutamyl-peptidase